MKRRKRKFKNYQQDLEAMRIADRYNMVDDYKEARRHRLSPQEALEDWDLCSKCDTPRPAGTPL